MPTRNISLTAEHDAFLDNALKTGEYQDASDAVRDAIRALLERREDDRRKDEGLRAAIEEGLEALGQGAFSDVDDEELDAYLDDIAVAPKP